MFRKFHQLMKSGRIQKVVNMVQNGKGKQTKTKRNK